MMKFVKVLCALVVVLMTCSAFSLKGNKNKPVYMVGVAASFTDSLMYFTEVQFVDSVFLDKDNLLPGRNLYSDQLENYLEYEEGLPNRTCFVYFSHNKKKLQKQVTKMKQEYQKGNTMLIRQVNPNAFQFKKADLEY